MVRRVTPVKLDIQKTRACLDFQDEGLDIQVICRAVRRSFAPSFIRAVSSFLYGSQSP